MRKLLTVKAQGKRILVLDSTGVRMFVSIREVARYLAQLFNHTDDLYELRLEYAREQILRELNMTVRSNWNEYVKLNDMQPAPGALRADYIDDYARLAATTRAREEKHRQAEYAREERRIRNDAKPAVQKSAESLRRQEKALATRRMNHELIVARVNRDS